MNQQTSSMVSDSRASGEAEAESSDSISSTVLQNPSKRPPNGPSSGRFKGVVPQQNGNWGAQIYANQQKIWLGTFKSEEEAAMVYDSAAIKLLSGDAHRNFPWTPDALKEPDFQSLFSQETVLGMIKDSSYRSKFANYLHHRPDRIIKPTAGPAPGPQGEAGGLLWRHLFQKELTPSDVGKLNRLVIPKKYAVKHFPRVISDRPEGALPDDLQLVFYDSSMKMWKFRYCYWSSSQSFVFTRGWSRFVKEKDLRANDAVSFYLCEYTDVPAKENRSFCMIDISRNQQQQKQLDDEEVIGGTMGAIEDTVDEVIEEEPVVPSNPTTTNTKGFRLFGVQINY